MNINLYIYNIEKKYSFLIPLTLIITIIIGISSRLIVANDQIDWDEELYFLIARGWRQLVLPYSGIFDHKPPVLYLIYLLLSGWGKHFYLVRILTTVLLLGCSFFLVNALGSVYDSVKKNGLLLATALFIYFCFDCGLGSNSEMIYIPPLLLTLALLIKEKPFIAAFFATVTLSIKYTTALDLLGVALLYCSISWGSKKFFNNLAIWVVCTIIATFFSYFIFYLYFKNHDVDIIQVILLKNLHHASSDRTEIFSHNGLTLALHNFAPLLLLGLWLNWQAKTKLIITTSLTLWFFLSLTQGMLTGKYYYHYFIPAAIPLILLIALSKIKCRYIIYITTIFVFILSLKIFSNSIYIHQNSVSNMKNFTPYCPEIQQGAYVMDNFISAYRICEAKKIDKFVFPPFYADSHFSNISTSGGLEKLKDKINSGEIKGIIAVKNSILLKTLTANNFKNIIELNYPDQKKENKISEIKIILKSAIKYLVDLYH